MGSKKWQEDFKEDLKGVPTLMSMDVRITRTFEWELFDGREGTACSGERMTIRTEEDVFDEPDFRDRI